MAISASLDCSIDLISHPDVCERFRASIAHEDGGFTCLAVGAGMTASSIRIDRPVEREELPGNVVDDRFRFYLDELDTLELRGVEGPPADLEQGLPFHGSRI